MDGVVIAACITAIVAFISTIIKPIVENNMKTKELRMKTRLDWIADVRQLTAKLTTSMTNFYTNAYAVGFYFKENPNAEIDKGNISFNRMTEAKEDILEYSSLLRLYFGKNDSDGRNKIIINSLNESVIKVLSLLNDEYNGTYKLNRLIENPETYSDLANKITKELTTEVSDYLKSEWDNAKKGK